MEKYNKSLSNLLIAIQDQIKLIEDQIKNTYGAKLDELQQMFSKDINALEVSDLKEQPLSKLKRIAEFIELGDKYNRLDFEDDDNLSLLLNDINEYIKVNNNRLSDAENKLKMRAIFVDILTLKKIPNNVKDAASLKTLNKEFNICIDSLGSVSNEDKMVAYKTMGEVIHGFASQKMDPEIVNDVTYSYSYVIDNHDVKNLILKYIEDNGLIININFLNTYSKEIADYSGRSPELIQNVLVGMIMGQEFNRYQKGASKRKTEKMLTRLNEYVYDDKKVVMAEANKILRGEINELRNFKINNFEEIVVTEATDEDEFNMRKMHKKTMIAFVLKEKLEVYKNNTNLELDKELKSLIVGLIEEYQNTDTLEFSNNRTR